MNSDDMLSTMTLIEVQWHADVDAAIIEALVKLEHVPAAVVINVLASKLAFFVPMAIEEGRMAGEDYDLWSEDMEQRRRETFKRVMDAVFSMEDYDARKAPWRAQSTKGKKHDLTVRMADKPKTAN